MRQIFCVIYVLFVALSSFAGAKISCEKKNFDFGSMHDGQTASHTYIIKNIGDADLTIGKIRACCGSTATISSKLIKPGEQAELKAVLPLRNRRGRQDKNIFIASNDLKNPYYQLKFTGFVNQRVMVEPRSVSFKDLKLGMTAEQEVMITSIIPFEVTKIESNSKAFIASIIHHRGTESFF